MHRPSNDSEIFTTAAGRSPALTDGAPSHARFGEDNHAGWRCCVVWLSPHSRGRPPPARAPCGPCAEPSGRRIGCLPAGRRSRLWGRGRNGRDFAWRSPFADPRAASSRSWRAESAEAARMPSSTVRATSCTRRAPDGTWQLVLLRSDNPLDQAGEGLAFARGRRARQPPRGQIAGSVSIAERAGDGAARVRLAAERGDDYDTRRGARVLGHNGSEGSGPSSETSLPGVTRSPSQRRRVSSPSLRRRSRSKAPAHASRMPS